MSTYADDYDGTGDFEMPVPGSVVAVIGGVYDVGLQETQFGTKKKIVVAYELEERDSKGRRFIVFTPYSASAHPKSAYRKVLDACGIKPERDAQGRRKPVDLTLTQGHSVMLTVGLTDKGKARAENVAPLPAQLRPGITPEHDFSKPFGLASWYAERQLKRAPRRETSSAASNDDIPF
jgi:hypothetical protein